MLEGQMTGAYRQNETQFDSINPYPRLRHDFSRSREKNFVFAIFTKSNCKTLTLSSSDCAETWYSVANASCLREYAARIPCFFVVQFMAMLTRGYGTQPEN